jgi:3-oxoacyl-[acyl-carrier protein] reductase
MSVMSIRKKGKKMERVKFDFSGKTALVVGGTSGIGFETARQLSVGGAKVFIASKNKPEDLSFAQFIHCDVRKENQVENMINEMVKQEGKIDILVNSMAVNQCKPIEEISLSDWQDVMAVNITGIFLVCKTVLPYMKKMNMGKIVNVSSIAGRHRSPVSGVHYVASKSAIIGFSKQLAYEAAPFGINVNVHCPSQTMTPLLKDSMSEQEIEHLKETIPFKRLASVEEQAASILFLCSEASSYMSGAILDVNGGQI